jgi:hypothetical protein
MHGELLMLGFDVSERTISRWMKRAPRDSGPRKSWLTFLRNHKEPGSPCNAMIPAQPAQSDASLVTSVTPETAQPEPCEYRGRRPFLALMGRANNLQFDVRGM